MTRKLKTEEAVCRIFSKWVFLKYPQKFRNTHRKIPMLESLLIKVVDLKLCNFTKKSLQYRYFPVDIAKFSRKHFFREHFRWLLLSKRKSISLSQLVRSIENNLHRCAEAMRLFCKKNVFLKTSLYSQESTCAGVSVMIKLHTSSLQFIKKRLQHRGFPTNFANLLQNRYDRTYAIGCLFKWMHKSQQLTSLIKDLFIGMT